MKKFTIVKIWIGVEIAALLALAVLVICEQFVFEPDETGKNYQIPESVTQETQEGTFELPRDLTVDEYEGENANVEGDFDAEGETLTGSIYKTDFPEEVLERLASMSEREKTDVLLTTTPEVLCEKSKVTVAGSVFSDAFAQKPVSGIFFSDANFVSEASGMEMLKTIRGWSREASGLNLLLGYDKASTNPQALSDRGFNLFCLEDGQDAQEAVDALMVPAFTATFEDAPEITDTVAVIIKTDDAAKIVSAINDGKTYLYRVNDYQTVRDALGAAAESGEIIPEALDSAAGYVLTLRSALTQMRPEEMEKESPKAAPAKKTTKQKTPEEQAAELQKQLEKQLQKQLQDQAAAAAAPQ